MKVRHYILASLVVFSALICGCERRPLEDVDDRLWLNLVIDLNVKNMEGQIQTPELMHAIFYDPTTMVKVADDYVKATGGLVNIQPGKYKLVVYNFDTESTLIRNDYYVPSIEAYTSDIPTSTKSSLLTKLSASTKADPALVEPDPNIPIVYEPDHLFVARKDVEILRRSGTQTIEANAETIVETYYLGIRLLNKQNLASAQALLSGQVKSNKFGFDGGKSTEEVTLYFNMYAGVNDKTGEDVLQTKFSTFGKLPNSTSRLWLTIVITNTSGTTETWQQDITDQFIDNEDKYIYIESPAIDPPGPGTPTGNGGFHPTVEDWEETNIDLKI